MDNKKNDSYYINEIIDNINFILKHAKNLSLDKLENDEVLTYAICFKFTQMSEACSKLSNEYKSNNDDIPWRQISGLRNLIVHDYGHVKLEIIYQTIINDLPNLVKKLKKSNR